MAQFQPAYLQKNKDDLKSLIQHFLHPKELSIRRFLNVHEVSVKKMLTNIV